MSPTALLLVLGSVLLTAGAQLALKVASGKYAAPVASDSIVASMVQQFFHPLTLMAIAAYVGSLLLWLLALRQVPLSLAYPLSGLTIAVVVFMGKSVLGESLSVQHGLGIALIIGGVVLLAAKT